MFVELECMVQIRALFKALEPVAQQRVLQLSWTIQEFVLSTAMRANRKWEITLETIVRGLLASAPLR